MDAIIILGIIILALYTLINIVNLFAIPALYREEKGVKSRNFRVAWKYAMSEIKEEREHKVSKALVHLGTIAILPVPFLVASFSSLVSQK